MNVNYKLQLRTAAPHEVIALCPLTPTLAFAGHVNPFLLKTFHL